MSTTTYKTFSTANMTRILELLETTDKHLNVQPKTDSDYSKLIPLITAYPGRINVTSKPITSDERNYTVASRTKENAKAVQKAHAIFMARKRFTVEETMVKISKPLFEQVQIGELRYKVRNDETYKEKLLTLDDYDRTLCQITHMLMCLGNSSIYRGIKVQLGFMSSIENSVKNVSCCNHVALYWDISCLNVGFNYITYRMDYRANKYARSVIDRLLSCSSIDLFSPLPTFHEAYALVPEESMNESISSIDSLVYIAGNQDLTIKLCKSNTQVLEYMITNYKHIITCFLTRKIYGDFAYSLCVIPKFLELYKQNRSDFLVLGESFNRFMKSDKSALIQFEKLIKKQLATMEPEKHNDFLGKHLYMAIKNKVEDRVPKLTGMMLQLPQEDIIKIIVHPTILDEKIMEAFEVLNAKESEPA